jgi:hypothetical protein
VETTKLEETGKLYATIGNEVAAALPPAWEKAWLQVEIIPESTAVGAYYIGGTTKTPAGVKMPRTLFRIFEQLHRLAKQYDSNNVWTNLTFTLDRSGKFDVEYGYDPVPIEGEYERRLAWMAKHLPS